MTTVRALAPAKLNLGLEVIGKRADGYHDIATVMQTVSLFDRLTATPGSEIALHVSDPSLAGEDNLVLAAARLLRSSVGQAGGASIELKKRIPTAAGLGGASSDAAATLVSLSQLWDARMPPDKLLDLASRLGSDVPFLVEGGAALVEGRGETLTPLRPLAGAWFVLVVPAVSIPRKTPTLYGALTPDDFTSGDRVRRLATAIEAGGELDPELLANAFRRPLLALRPELGEIERVFADAGAPVVALSGAGPTLYTAVREIAQARRLAGRLHASLPSDARVVVCRPVSQAPLIRIGDG
jgi:4-diphosphocytidyl-2-C-methyl-D-erythritol kinase